MSAEGMDTSSDKVDEYFQGVSLDDPEFKYPMKKRGKFIIIYNKTFPPDTIVSEHSQTDQDAATSLEEIFKKLGFDVKLCINLTTVGMLRCIRNASAEDHSDFDCFGVIVLSLGHDNGIYGTDGTIPIKNFVDPIDRCKSLIGKPKIFIFQACGGKALDNTQQFPLKNDTLYVYSIVPGSWYVHALKEALSKPESHEMDFISILTRVNDAVGCQLESSASNPGMNIRIQVPSIVSMLSKDLYLCPK